MSDQNPHEITAIIELGDRYTDITEVHCRCGDKFKGDNRNHAIEIHKRHADAATQMSETASQRVMSDVEKLGEIVHHALWPGAPRSMYPRLTEADRARYRSVAVAVVDALGLTEEWRTTGWLGPVPESLARSQAESEGTLQRRIVGQWTPAT